MPTSDTKQLDGNVIPQPHTPSANDLTNLHLKTNPAQDNPTHSTQKIQSKTIPFTQTNTNLKTANPN
jgi:hypothetical protein